MGHRSGEIGEERHQEIMAEEIRKQNVKLRAFYTYDPIEFDVEIPNHYYVRIQPVLGYLSCPAPPLRNILAT